MFLFILYNELERFTSRAKHVDNLVLNHFFHHSARVAEVLTRVEVAGLLAEMLTDSRRERYAKVAVDIDFANRHLRSLSKLGFGNTDCVRHMAAELVDDSNLVLGNGRRAVQNDRETGKSIADFFQDIQTKLGVLTGLKLVSTVGSTDSDCKGVDTRFCNEFFYFVGGSELCVCSVDVYVVFDTSELTKLCFNHNAVVVRVFNNLFRDSDVFVPRMGRSVDHNGRKAAVDRSLANFEISAVVKVHSNGDIVGFHTKKINYVPFYDIILSVVGAGSFLYYAIFQEDIILMSRRIGTLQIIIALVAILILVELCRRAVGWPIIIVAGCFVAYAAVNAIGKNPDTALRSLMYGLFYDVSNGLFSTPVYVCTTFIVLFIILGALLEKTGIGTFFVDLANSIAGSSIGGPAKVAVISSALEGMYSGSSVANTVGSGSITIPMMKKTGYKPEFAAAVEAAASTGGQIMPPIMGAAAFLMSEITETPYSTIAVTAILPAVLYFTGIFMMIHFEAKKLGLKGLCSRWFG